MADSDDEFSGVRLLGDLQRVELRPGDRLVLKTRHNLTADSGRQVRQLLADAFEGGAEIGVIGVE